MSAVHVLRPLRRGVAPLAVCFCLTTVPAAAWRDTGPSRPPAAAHDGAHENIVLAQAGGAPVSPYQEPAPNLFEATGTALWDGKRTLQGVWVAHPLATSARRARIYNAETGAAVDGALFRRDPALSGPPVLVSSEAARFLGMTPGDEVGLRIVALIPSQRPETQPAPARQPAATPPPEQSATSLPAMSAATRPAEPPTAAAQSQDAPFVERTEPTTAPAEPATALAVPVPRPERPTETVAAQPVAVPVRKTPLANPQSAPEATSPSEPAPATETAAQAASRETATVRPPSQAAALGDSAKESTGKPTALIAAATIAEPTPEASAPSQSRPVFQPAPLRPASDTLAAAPSLLPAARPTANPTVAPPANAPAMPPEPAGAPTSEPDTRLSAIQPDPAPALSTRPAAATPLSQPYVQAGIFRVVENADRLLGRLKAADLPALGKPMQLNGKPAIRVLAGPFAAAAERDAAVRTIRGMGLRDAAPVAR